MELRKIIVEINDVYNFIKDKKMNFYAQKLEQAMLDLLRLNDNLESLNK